MSRLLLWQANKKTSPVGHAVRQGLGITLGSLIAAVGVALFLVPNKIASGGVSGFSTIIYYLTGWPVGTLMIICNVPLFFLGFRRFGYRSMVRSLYGALILSVFIDLLAFWQGDSKFVGDPLLASLYGGVLTGIGLGLVFRSGGTTGGTDLLARLLYSNLGLSLGSTLLTVDGFVILLAAIFFDLELALYALIAVYITSRMIDVVLEGISYHKAVLIISDKYEALGKMLLSRLDRGITGLVSRGIYTGKTREALLCVVGQGELTALKEMIYEVDANAFIIITQAHEVLGEGFRPFEIKEGEGK